MTADSDSQAVLAVLRRYYAEVGGEAVRFGGSLKDQAGDGVLILVGAPIPGTAGTPWRWRAPCAKPEPASARNGARRGWSLASVSARPVASSPPL